MAEESGKGNMRPILSLCGLLAKSSIYKVLAVLLVMAAAEGISIYMSLSRRGRWSLEELVEDSLIPIAFLAALSVIFFILARTESAVENKSGNMMLRLRLSRKQIFLMKTVYNLFCLCLPFLMQIWIVIGIASACGQDMAAGASSPRGLFLAFYRSEFLHCLLPMEEAGKWMRNILLLAALGMDAAVGIGKRNYVVPICLFAMTAGWFVSPIGHNVTDTACAAMYGAVIAVDLYRAMRDEEGKRA